MIMIMIILIQYIHMSMFVMIVNLDVMKGYDI